MEHTHTHIAIIATYICSEKYRNFLMVFIGGEMFRMHSHHMSLACPVSVTWNSYAPQVSFDVQ